MADWTEPDVNTLLPGEPWTTSKAIAAFENPSAIAEGAAGATPVEVAWHVVETLEPTADAATMTLATDPSDYRAIRLFGAFKITSTTNATASVQIQVDSGWRTILTTASDNNHYFDVTITETDAFDGYDVIGISGLHASGGGFDRSDAVIVSDATAVCGSVTYSGAVTGIRVTSASDIEGDSPLRPLFRLQGIKRTLPAV